MHLKSAELTDVVPAEYRADLVVLLVDGKPVLGIVVEVQLKPDARKRFSWPVYVAGLRARLECPCCLLVVTASDSTAKYARLVYSGKIRRVAATPPFLRYGALVQKLAPVSATPALYSLRRVIVNPRRDRRIEVGGSLILE